MRKVIFLPAAVTGMLLLSLSCSKHSHDEIIRPAPAQTINVTIAPNQAYQLDLTGSGSSSISSQASHYLVSAMITSPENSNTYYKYVPAANFTGTDKVVLVSTFTTTTGGSGCPNNGGGHTSTSSCYTTVNITVAN